MRMKMLKMETQQLDVSGWSGSRIDRKFTDSSDDQIQIEEVEVETKTPEIRTLSGRLVRKIQALLYIFNFEKYNVTMRFEYQGKKVAIVMDINVE